MFVNPSTGAEFDTGFYERVTFAKIPDGSSNTLVIGEKFLDPRAYDGTATELSWHDDKGWADGWDPDTLRSTICTFGSDRKPNLPRLAPPVSALAAHTSGMNAGFADGAVRHLNYQIEPELFNRLGHRSDDEAVSMESL